ncbi:MAG: hypothetical protein U0869_19055 [Chloroflexota bacterium]
MAGRRLVAGAVPVVLAVLALGGAGGTVSAQSPAASAPAASPASSVDPAAQAGIDALLAIFPDTYDDVALDVRTETGAELLGTLSPDALAAIDAALGTAGKTHTDVSAALAYTSSGGLIAAFRVAGADGTAFVEPFLGALIPPAAEVVRGSTTIGDRAVTTVTAYAGTLYVFASGDVVWLIGMDEQGATDLIGTLP